MGRKSAPAALRYDVPFAAPPPTLVNPAVGIARLVARGDEHSYPIQVTVLDAPDHRLVRAGVLLAHRVVDGAGEWYLAAPAWAPFLPAEQVTPLGGDEDLPFEIARLILPFRRRATLGPVAALEARRDEYHLRGAGGAELARLRDERVTIRRGGLTTARFREVTIEPTAALTGDQRASITDAIVAIGGAPAEAFPTLAQRIGAPATGGSDLPARRPIDADDTLEQVVSALVSGHLHAIVAADLALRSGAVATPRRVLKLLGAARDDLRGLYPVLDPGWLGELVGDIDWVLDAPAATPAAVLLGDRYLDALDRLVAAARAPRLGDVARRKAGPVLASELAAAATTFASRAEPLTVSSPDEDWAAALASARNVVAIAGVVDQLPGRHLRHLGRELTDAVAALADCSAIPSAPDAAALAALDPAAAFAAGRTHERATLVQDLARGDFVDGWPRLARALAKLARA